MMPTQMDGQADGRTDRRNKSYAKLSRVVQLVHCSNDRVGCSFGGLKKVYI